MITNEANANSIIALPRREPSRFLSGGVILIGKANNTDASAPGSYASIGSVGGGSRSYINRAPGIVVAAVHGITTGRQQQKLRVTEPDGLLVRGEIGRAHV